MYQLSRKVAILLYKIANKCKHSSLPSYQFFRLDFEDVVLLQPLMAITGNEDGLCANAGQRGDAIKVKTSTTRMVGFNELCGTLTGQYGKASA